MSWLIVNDIVKSKDDAIKFGQSLIDSQHLVSLQSELTSFRDGK